MLVRRWCCALKCSTYIPQTIDDNFIPNLMLCDVFHFISNLAPLWDPDCDSAKSCITNTIVYMALQWVRQDLNQSLYLQKISIAHLWGSVVGHLLWGFGRKFILSQLCHTVLFFTFIFKGSQHQGLFNMALSASQDLRMFNTTAITGNHRIRSNPCSIPCQQSPKLSQTDSQSPSTALTAGNLPAVRAVPGTVSGLKNYWKFSPVLWAYNALQLISNPLQMILPQISI